MTTTATIDYTTEQGMKILLDSSRELREAPPAFQRTFAEICKRTQLDPLARQIYPAKRTANNVDKWSADVSIDGFRLVAQRSGDYAGQVGPEWCGPDGVWRDIWTSAEHPFAARVGVLRRGFSAPLYAIAKWSSYAATTKGELTFIWKKFPDLMLAKCAEALALRRAFPMELSGLYTTEEMGQADTWKTGPSGGSVSDATFETIPGRGAEDSEDELAKKLAASVTAKAKLPDILPSVPPEPPSDPDASDPDAVDDVPEIQTRSDADDSLSPEDPADAIIAAIDSAKSVAAMQAVVDVILKIKDPAVSTAASARFKARRGLLGYELRRVGAATIVFDPKEAK